MSRRFVGYTEIVIGDDHENPTRLDCMDWLGDMIPCNQDMIRPASEGHGFWAVDRARGPLRVCSAAVAGVDEFSDRSQCAILRIRIERPKWRSTAFAKPLAAGSRLFDQDEPRDRPSP